MAETEAPVPEARAPVALKDSKTHTHTHIERNIQTDLQKHVNVKILDLKT